MKLRTLTFALALILTWKPALATGVDEVRTILLNGDVAKLEATMSELAKATDAPSIEAYREISDRLFRSSHPVYLATLADWLEGEPRSGAALAANAWAAINRVYLTSSPYGDGYSMPKLPDFQKRWIDSRDRAFDLAERALRTDRRNVSAIDAWLFAQTFKRTEDDTARVASTLMNLAPNRQSVKNIVAANFSFAQSGSRAVVDACHTYARSAKDYDHTLCMIEAAFEFFLEQDFRDEAEKQLSKIDDSRLDQVRFVAATMDPKKGGDASMLMRYHRATLVRRVDPSNYFGDAQRIAWMTDNPAYVEAARGELTEKLVEWLGDDPHNPRYLLHQAYLHQQQGDYAKAREAWRNAVVHGWPDLNVWLIGAMTEFSDGQLSAGASYIEGAAAAAGNKIELLTVHQIFHDAIEQSSATPEEAVLCLRARIARLSKGLCDVYGERAGSICKPGRPPFQGVTEALSMIGRSCPSMGAASISELQFSAAAAQDMARALAGGTVD